jgi:hypothetical protein
LRPRLLRGAKRSAERPGAEISRYLVGDPSAEYCLSGSCFRIQIPWLWLSVENLK